MTSRSLVWNCAAAGAAALTIQIVFLREGLTLFHGSEWSWGIVLGAWLAFGAAGCAAGRRGDGPVDWTFALAAIAAAAGLAAIRFAPVLWGVPSGATLTLGQAAITATAALALPSALVGSTFPRLARLVGSASTAYGAEAAGAMAAGLLLAGLVLIRSTPIALAASAAAIPAASRRTILPVAVAAGIALTAWIGERDVIEAAWRARDPGMEVLEYRAGRVGPVEAVRYGGDVTIYVLGRSAASLPDRGEAAPLVHFLLSQVAEPSRVLLHGGAAGGWCREIARHDAPDLVVAAPDRDRWDVELAHASPEDRQAVERATLVPRDPRGLLAEGPWDAVLLHAGDPTTLSANRMYTLEFAEAARDALAPGGVVAVGPIASYVGSRVEELAVRNGALYRTFRDVFAHVAITPGRSAWIVAADHPLEFDRVVIENRLGERGIDAPDLGILVDPFYVEAMAWEMRTGLPFDPLAEPGGGESLDGPRNLDARPIAHLGSDASWGRIEDDRLRSALAAIPAALGAWVWALALLPFAWGAGRGGSGRVRLFGAGWAAMTAQMLLLFAFQSAGGSIYHHGVTAAAAFMAGTAAGAWRGAPWRAASVLLSAACGAAGFAFGATASLAILVAESAVAGLLLGAVFARESLRSPAAGLYAADLAGGVAGGLLTATVLMPAAGSIGTGAIPAVALAATLLMRKSPKTPPSGSASTGVDS